jgi:hypothetical protein
MAQEDAVPIPIDEDYGQQGVQVRIDEQGVLLVNNRPVGEMQGSLLELNLGWCRMAGLSLRVHDDPAIDRHRGGIALERLVASR